jgi:hypothetical protein
VVASETKSGLFLLEEADFFGRSATMAKKTGEVLQKMGFFAPDSVLPNQLQFFWKQIIKSKL